jgi:O-Antigen ligase
VVLRRRGRDPLWAVAATLALGITWVGLLPSFSQSSYVALMAGVAVAAIVMWRWRSLVLLGVAAVVLLVVVGASPQLRHRIQGKTSSLSHITSGRSTLARNGIKLAVHNPVFGVGVGGFKRAYADETGLKGREPKAAASHTTPITVAAEGGLPGLLLLLVLAWFALLTAFRRLGPFFEGTARLGFGLALTAIFVHCLFYNALFEDPTFWGLLALVVVGARADGALEQAA